MSTLDKNKEYMVLNYVKSPVAITTRDSRYLIPGGTATNPAEFPLTLSELTYINSNSKVFQIGVLFFEPEYEEEIYTSLRIRDWKNILKNEEIDEIILNPTTEKLQMILEIQEAMYFERIYGRYVGLKNAGRPISSFIENFLKTRKSEFSHGKIRSEIKIRETELPSARIGEQDEKIAEMQKQIEHLTSLLAQQVPNDNPVKEEVVEQHPDDNPVTTQRKTGRRTTGRKKETAQQKEE